MNFNNINILCTYFWKQYGYDSWFITCGIDETNDILYLYVEDVEFAQQKEPINQFQYKNYRLIYKHMKRPKVDLT